MSAGPSPSPTGYVPAPLTPMRVARAVALVAGAILLAAALTEPVYRTLLGWDLVRDRPGDPDRMFLKVFRRLLLGFVGIVFLALVRPWRDRDGFGLRPWRPGARVAARAWVATVVLTALLVVFLVAVDALAMREEPSTSKVLRTFGKVFIGGVCAALLEEWFFRGWLDRMLVARHGTLVACILGPLLYAIAHAFKPGTLETEVALTTSGALEALGQWFLHALAPASFGPAVFGLFLFGLVLLGLRRRTDSLWTSIGVHAAGAFVVYGHLALTTRPASEASLWLGTKRLYDGVPAWIILGLAAWWLWRPGSRPEGDAEAGQRGTSVP